MKEQAIEQARALISEVPDRQEVLKFQDVMNLCPEFVKALESPVIRTSQKIAAIKRVAEKAEFSERMTNFLCELTKNHGISEIPDILEAYAKLWDRKNHHMRVEAIFASQPTDEELKSAREYLKTKYAQSDIQFCVDVDPSLIGGRILRARGVEYDQSYAGRLAQLERKLTEEA